MPRSGNTIGPSPRSHSPSFSLPSPPILLQLLLLPCRRDSFSLSLRVCIHTSACHPLHGDFGPTPRVCLFLYVCASRRHCSHRRAFHRFPCAHTYTLAGVYGRGESDPRHGRREPDFRSQQVYIGLILSLSRTAAAAAARAPNPAGDQATPLSGDTSNRARARALA